MCSPKEARRLLAQLRATLEYLGVYDSEKEGSLRVDANISIRGHERAEVKNISSYRGVEKALTFEITRQRSLIRRGAQIERETRHFVEARGTTTSSALEGRGARLPLLPRAGPAAAPGRGLGRRDRAPRAPGRAARPVRVAVRPLGEPRADAHGRPAPGRLLRGGRRRRPRARGHLGRRHPARRAQLPRPDGRDGRPGPLPGPARPREGRQHHRPLRGRGPPRRPGRRRGAEGRGRAARPRRDRRRRGRDRDRRDDRRVPPGRGRLPRREGERDQLPGRPGHEEDPRKGRPAGTWDGCLPRP